MEFLTGEQLDNSNLLNQIAEMKRAIVVESQLTICVDTENRFQK
jgi:hypothetical protein